GAWLKQDDSAKPHLNPLLFKRLIKQFYNQVAVYVEGDRAKKTILFYSIELGEGKTFLIHKFVEELLSQGKTVSYIHPINSQDANVPGVNYISYSEGSINSINWDKLTAASTGEYLIFEHSNIQLSNI